MSAGHRFPWRDPKPKDWVECTLDKIRTECIRTFEEEGALG